MSNIVIQVEHLSKQYHLGTIGGKRLADDLNRWWAKARNKADPTLKIGQESQARLNGEKFKALQDINFEVNQGEILGIIGRNGAGKSTLLKILSRVTAPTSGEVRVKGRIASLLEVGTGFHPELTGRENIFLNGAILGMTKIEIKNKFDEVVAFSGVEDFIDTPVKRYSSGMYVRLAFAVAAHLEPEILIVDEVLAVGDAEFQKKCIGKMQDVSRTGRTILFVSHNMDAVLRLCNTAIILQAGQLLFHGLASQALANYSRPAADNKQVIEVRNRSNAKDIRGQVLIRRFRWLLSNGRLAWMLEFEEDILFEIEFDVLSNVDFADLGIGLFSSTGIEIASCLSSHCSHLQSLSQGRHRCRVRYRHVRLLPGCYFLNLGLRSNFGMEDYVSEAIRFEVVSNARSSAFQVDTFKGFYVPHTEISFEAMNND